MKIIICSSRREATRAAGKIKFRAFNPSSARPACGHTSPEKAPVHHYNQFNQSVLSVYLFSSCQRRFRKQKQTKLLLENLRDLLFLFSKITCRHFCKTTNKKSVSFSRLAEPEQSIHYLLVLSTSAGR